MGVYNNNKDGTRSTLANTIQVVDAPMEQFVSKGEFSAVTPNDVSADNKLVAENEVTKAVDTMPTASADYVGQIVQYVGTTTVNYTNGYFYKCVSDGAVTPTYSWVEVISGSGDLPFVTPEQFGAKGDGVTDDTEAFTAAFVASPNVKCDGSKTYKFTGVVINDNTGSDLDLCGATFLNFHIKVRIAADGYKSSDPNSSNFFKMHDGHLGKFTEIPSDWQIPAIQCGTQMWVENLTFINTPYVAALTNNYRDRMVFKNLLMINDDSLWTGITWTLDAINLITGNGTFARINTYDINHVATDTNSFAGDGWVMDNIDEFKSSNQSDYFFIHTRNQHTLNINRCVQTRIAIGTNTHVEFSNCHFENITAMPVIETLTDSSTSAVPALYQVDFDNCWFTDEYTLEVDKPNISYTNCYFRVCENAVYPTTPFATVMGNRDFYNIDCKIIDCVFDIENNIINSEIWKKYKEQPKLTCNSYSGTTNEGTLANSIDTTKTIASGQYKYPITGTYSYVGYTFNNSTCNDDINNNRIAHEKYEWTRTVNSVNSDMDGSRGIVNIIGGWVFEIYRTLPDNTIQRARFYDSPIEEGKQNVTQKKFHIRECGNYLIINKTVSYGSTYTEIGYRLPWVTVTSIPNYTVNAQVYEKNGVLVTLDGSIIPNLTNKAYVQVNATKPAQFEVTTSGWTADTTSQSGTTLYKKSITLAQVNTEMPTISIGATGTLPTVAQQAAFNLVQYVTLDNTVPCLYLYASAIPTDAFYIKAEGVS